MILIECPLLLIDRHLCVFAPFYEVKVALHFKPYLLLETS